jgi:hypothetical protein
MTENFAARSYWTRRNLRSRRKRDKGRWRRTADSIERHPRVRRCVRHFATISHYSSPAVYEHSQHAAENGYSCSGCQNDRNCQHTVADRCITREAPSRAIVNIHCTQRRSSLRTGENYALIITARGAGGTLCSVNIHFSRLLYNRETNTSMNLIY